MNIIHSDHQQLSAGAARTISGPKPRELTQARPLRVAFIGAGNISATHAQIVSGNPVTRLVGVVDSQLGRAEAFARQWKIAAAHKSLEDLLGATEVDALHILTPPDQHASGLIGALKHDVAVLVEKPLAASVAGVDQVVAKAPNRFVYVNHNFVFHPAFQAILKVRDSGELGVLTNVSVTYSMPLRQLKSGQFSHWMFRQTANLLLEQAVHPLSQLVELAGAPMSVKAVSAANGVIAELGLHTSLSANLCFGTHQGQLTFDLQSPYPVWEITALFTDGIARADILRNLVTIRGQTHQIEAVDHALHGLAIGKSLRRQSRHAVWSYALSQLGLGPRADGFFQSMKASLACFHQSRPAPFVNERDGARLLVQLCEDVARQLPAVGATRPTRAIPSPANSSDVSIIGGTGFIGRHIAKQFLAQGATVSILARRTDYRPQDLDTPSVRFLSCDIRDPEALSRAIGSTKTVINTAGPDLSGNWELIANALRDQVSGLLGAYRANPSMRLIHLSSTAAMYLGKRGAKATGRAGPDLKAHLRADYARAKAMTDILLLSLHQEHGLPLTILRPGIVVGEGGTPFHSGVGLFVNEQHCLGWSAGHIALPFVLVRDVAAAAVSVEKSGQFAGQFYNLAGDVRLTAIEYVAALASATRRPITFHPQTAESLYVIEAAKGIIKRIGGKKAQFSSLRDLRSRAFLTEVDCSETKHDLAWRPEADESAFIRDAIEVHIPPGLRDRSTR